MRALFLVVLLAPAVASAGVASTRHNLSSSGPGTIKAASDDRICVFCHTPHSASASAPLWNRRDPGGPYTPYGSSTARAIAGQPTGASLLCLSCHDGTIALGEIRSQPAAIAMAGGVTTMPAGDARVGTNLSDDHPVSILYDAALAAARGDLASPATLTGPVRLDPNGRLQCTACHDPHSDGFGKFLVASTQASALCTTCHLEPGWSGSSHQSANKSWNGLAPNPWPHTAWTTVVDNGCENCHRPHTAGGGKRILNALAEEDNCLPCHNGNVATANISASIAKFSRHPVSSTTGVHDPAEPAIVATRHVECVDCHSPHQTRAGAPLTGVRGVNLAGVEVASVSFEYQVCFRCHADSPGKPPPLVTRQIAQTNVRLEYDPTNPSFHPVAGPGVNPSVPSLIAPYTTSSTIRCGDCHADDAGPAGPHGSIYSPLLVRQYLTADNSTESAAAYALCYACHSRASILGDQSFKEHNKHIVGERAPCSACHDAHGISKTQGNSTNNSKLINFDSSIVTPNTAGLLMYQSTGTFSGRCYLRCHGWSHDPLTY